MLPFYAFSGTFCIVKWFRFMLFVSSRVRLSHSSIRLFEFRSTMQSGRRKMTANFELNELFPRFFHFTFITLFAFVLFVFRSFASFIFIPISFTLFLFFFYSLICFSFLTTIFVSLVLVCFCVRLPLSFNLFVICCINFHCFHFFFVFALVHLAIFISLNEII